MTDNNEKILKWCGFEPFVNRKSDGIMIWIKKDHATINATTSIDMNFFFKWVVPKLTGLPKTEYLYDFKFHFHRESGEWYCDIAPSEYWGKGDTPEQAWQEALLKLIDAEVQYDA